ncbi:TetR family transcriptional regulator [bacterium]|nr:TetR family transcriptional regulator [bacterium]QQR59104.1 MAG: TetR family transcriptional regulator [Candidatus Melainabacteria bacterium]
MVRPRADNYEERRQEILDGAASMFAERGFDGTSIATIAQKCGVSKALLYHYYESKEALLFDMLHSHCNLLVQTAERAIEVDTKPKDQLDQFVKDLMNLYMDSRDKHIVLLNNLHCLPDEQQIEIKKLERRVTEIVKNLLSELKPELSEPVKSSLAMYLMGAINWTYTWFKPHGSVSSDEFAKLATTVFLHGIQSA